MTIHEDRAELEQLARKYAPAVRLDGMTDRDVRLAILAKISPDAVTRCAGKSDAYVTGTLSAVIALDAAGTADAKRRVDAAYGRVGRVERRDAPRVAAGPMVTAQAARERMVARLRGELGNARADAALDAYEVRASSVTAGGTRSLSVAEWREQQEGAAYGRRADGSGDDEPVSRQGAAAIASRTDAATRGVSAEANAARARYLAANKAALVSAKKKP